MSVKIIDTLKPKNNGSFPVVEAVDVAVTSDLRLPEALETKANASDVSFVTSDLQSQINQIEIGASAEAVVAPEVTAARIGTDATVYDTLKARLDAEKNEQSAEIETLRGTIINQDNLLLGAKFYPNKYYATGAEHDSDTYSYFIVPMEAGKTYVISKARFVADKYLNIDGPVSDGYELTLETAKDIYISFYNDTESNGEWRVYEKGKDATKIGSYQHPALVEGVLSRGTGNNDNIAISQKAVTEAIDELATQTEEEFAKPIDIMKISGVQIKDGTDLMPLAIESGDDGYYIVNHQIVKNTLEGYKYFKLPINGSNKYYLDDTCRWWFTTDDSGTVIDEGNNETSSFTTSEGSAILCVTYKAVSPKQPTRKIAVGSVPSDTIYVFSYGVETDIPSDIENVVNRLYYPANILDNCEVVPNKYYYNQTYYDYSQFSVLIFKVKGGKTYQFGCTVRAIATKSENIGEYFAALSTYTPSEDQELYCSILNELSDNWKVVEYPTDIDLVNELGVFTFNPDVIAQQKGTSKAKLMSQDAITKSINEATRGNVAAKIYGKGGATVSGDLSTGESLELPLTNVKKNNVYSFMAYISDFDTLLIGHGKNKYSGSWIEINDTKIVIHNYLNSETTAEYSHGLTISDYIYVQIIVSVQAAKIVLYSNGETYTIQGVTWYGDANGDTFAESVGSELTDCVFTWSSADFRKNVWMFGDSYFGMTSDSRWVKYLIDAGYGDNVLLNAFAGENSAQAYAALENMIEYYGMPDCIVWCLGMNDGSDSSSSSPSSQWMTNVNKVLEICGENGITPIFSTIPTVPNISHEGKNNFLRNSEYRYIDFAKAVGASGDGSWFDGMLSTDNVHPNASGAIALYHRAIADCPEITFGNP